MFLALTAFPGKASAEGTTRPDTAAASAPTHSQRLAALAAKDEAKGPKPTKPSTSTASDAMSGSGSTDTRPPARTPKAKQTTAKAAKKEASARSRTGASPTGRSSPPSAGATKSPAQVKTTAKPAAPQLPVKWAGQSTPATSRAQNTAAAAAAQSIPVVAATEPVAPTEPTGAAVIAAPGQQPVTIDGVTRTAGDLMSHSGVTIVPFSTKNANRSLTRLALAAAELPARLGTAGSFAILAGSTITNSGVSTINGDVGLDPGTAVTGFESCTGPADCVVLTGQLHVDDGVAAQAKDDLLTAYNGLVGLESTCTSIAVELGGSTLLPGVYCSPTFGLTGTLTLDGDNVVNPEFIFLTGSGGSTLITAAGSNVVLTNGANACNVYWQVATSATIGAGSAFAGNILAAQSISFGSAATLDGRAMATTSAVTLIGNTITRSDCTTLTVPPDSGGTPPGGNPPGGGTPPGANPPGGGSQPGGDRPGSGTRPGAGTSLGLNTTRLTATGLSTTGLTTTGLTATGLTATGLTATELRQSGKGGSSLAMTGPTVQIELLLAGLALGLGSLMTLLSQPRCQPHRKFANS